MENSKTIIYAEEFTRYPGGRYRANGDWSGQAFREDTLTAAHQHFSHVTVNMDNCFTVGPSFLDEAFGVFIEKMGPEEFHKHFTLVLTDDPDALREWGDIQKKRSTEFKKNHRK